MGAATSNESGNNPPSGGGSSTPGLENVYPGAQPVNHQHGSNYNLHQALADETRLQNTSSVPSATGNEPIRPEMLLAEIKGEIADNDYFARAMKILQNIHIEDIQFGKAEDAIELDDAYLLAEPGYLALENGIVRKADGSLYIAIFVDLGYEINGDMFDWWFCNVDNNEKFRWMHPLNHQMGTWDPAYYSMMNFERAHGHYIDHILITQQHFPAFTPSFNGDPAARPATDLYSIQTEFIRPSKFFDTSKFEAQNITSCLVGKINIKDGVFQTYLHIGYVFYMIREVNGRSELRVRYFLGDHFYYSMETSENYYYSQFIQVLTNNYLFRMMKLSMGLAKSVYKNGLEEMLCLKEFLPHYYQATLQQQRDFQLNYSFSN